MSVGVVATWLLYVLVTPSFGFPLSQELTESYRNEDFEEEGNLFEGDIILRPDQTAQLQQKELSEESLKSSIADPTVIWPNKTVFYQFQPGEFSVTQQTRIVEALNDIMSVSCVRFVQRTNQQTYVLVRNPGAGCAAAVGYHISGPMDLYLGGSACQTRGTIQHEFLHSLGFWHEHTRTDRDQHITVQWHNIQPGKEFNFNKRQDYEILTLGMPYDYNSVMHYRAIAFSRQGRETIVPKRPAEATAMGQRVRFSRGDLAKLNRMYRCPTSYYQGDTGVGEDVISPPEKTQTEPEQAQMPEDLEMNVTEENYTDKP